MRGRRKLVRGLRGAAALASALLFALVVVVWVRSYVASDWIRVMQESVGPEYDVIEDGHPVGHRDQLETEWGVQYGRGRIGVSLERRTNLGTDAQPGLNWQVLSPAPMDLSGLAPSADVLFDGLGFGMVKLHEPSDPGAASVATVVLFPCWFAALVTGAYPALWLTRWRREALAARRRRAGQCARCGYDLRASPDRCPECGAAPDVTAAADAAVAAA